MHVLLHSVPPTLQQAHASTGDSWTLPGKAGSISCEVSQCSFLLGPGVYKVLSVPFKSPFPSLVLAALSSVSVQSLSHVRLFATP